MLMLTPGTVLSASAMESSQNLAVKAGVSNVMNVNVVPVPLLAGGALVEHAVTETAATIAKALANTGRKRFKLFLPYVDAVPGSHAVAPPHGDTNRLACCEPIPIEDEGDIAGRVATGDRSPPEFDRRTVEPQ